MCVLSHGGDSYQIWTISAQVTVQANCSIQSDKHRTGNNQRAASGDITDVMKEEASAILYSRDEVLCAAAHIVTVQVLVRTQATTALRHG